MTIQDRIQQALGRLIFENLLLQQQLEDAQARIQRLEDQLKKTDGRLSPDPV